MIPLSDPDLKRRTTPYVLYGLILINVLVFVYELFQNNTQQTAFIYRYGAIPWELTGHGQITAVRMGPLGGVLDVASPVPTWATIFTSMFIHSGWLHIGGNMLFLWVFGDNIEDQFGHLKFLCFYLLSGVIAAWAQAYTVQAFAPTEIQVPMIGASGAIAGVLGAYIVMFPRSRILTLVFVFFIIPVRLPAFVLLGAWILLQAFSGIGSIGVTNTGSGVAYFAHLGGFAAGLAVGALYRVINGPPRPPTKQTYWRGRPIN